MTCAEFEEHIALDAGGDLPETQREALKEHLVTCADCQELAAELAVTQRALVDFGQQPIDDFMRLEVRGRVAAALAATPAPGTALQGAADTPVSSSGSRLKYWVVAALLVLGLGLSVGSLREPTRDHPAGPRLVVLPTPTWDGAASDRPGNLALAHVQAPALDIEPSFAPPPPTPALASKAATPSPPTSNPEPMVIQLVSDDNSVVIHWLVAATS